jgi:hypothetical protein
MPKKRMAPWRDGWMKPLMFSNAFLNAWFPSELGGSGAPAAVSAI